MSESKNQLQQEKDKLPQFMLPLTKEQKKIENAFNNNLASVLALLKGKAFAPQNNVPKDSIAEVMDEFFAEEIESKKEAVKVAMKTVLSKKVEFDKTVKQETQKFQSVIMQKKKELNGEIQEVLNLVGGINELKSNYLKSLNVTEVEELDDDKEAEE